MNLKKLKGFLRIAGPTICSCLASAGVVATAILSAKGALKAEKSLKDEKLSATEKTKAAAPAFVPATLSGLATIGFIFAANVLGEKQQASIIAATASLYKAKRECLDTMKNSDDVPDGLLTFYDPLSKRYFKRTMEEVLVAEYHLNRNFILRGYAPLNEFYEFLGLDKTADGEKLGWSQEMGGIFYGYEWIDFEHPYVGDENHSEHDYYILDIPFPPTDDYLSDPYDM